MFGYGIIQSVHLPSHLPPSLQTMWGICGEKKGGRFKSFCLTKAGKEFNFLIYFCYLFMMLTG